MVYHKKLKFLKNFGGKIYFSVISVFMFSIFSQYEKINQSGLASVSIIEKDSKVCDVLSTALFVMGLLTYMLFITIEQKMLY
jgi:Membrane-associated lipoprotein involved in thiamine biosynthesis